MTWVEVEKGWALRWIWSVVAICVAVYAFTAYDIRLPLEPSHLGELFMVLLVPGFPLLILFFVLAHISASFLARRFFQRNVPIATFLITMAFVVTGGFVLEFHDQCSMYAEDGVGVAVHKGLKAVLACLFAFTVPAMIINRIGRPPLED